MIHKLTHSVKRILISLLTEEELLSHSRHPALEKFFLTLRNTAAGAAVLLFLLSVLTYLPAYRTLMAWGYFCGAAAYFFELALLTDCFTERVPRKELFMAYCFGPMYVLLGINYLLGH